MEIIKFFESTPGYPRPSACAAMRGVTATGGAIVRREAIETGAQRNWVAVLGGFSAHVRVPATDAVVTHRPPLRDGGLDA